jgi:hypothetical protein
LQCSHRSQGAISGKKQLKCACCHPVSWQLIKASSALSGFLQIGQMVFILSEHLVPDVHGVDYEHDDEQPAAGQADIAGRDEKVVGPDLGVGWFFVLHIF